jgi:hypothetical protein
MPTARLMVLTHSEASNTSTGTIETWLLAYS